MLLFPLNKQYTEYKIKEASNGTTLDIIQVGYNESVNDVIGLWLDGQNIQIYLVPIY